MPGSGKTQNHAVGLSAGRSWVGDSLHHIGESHGKVGHFHVCSLQGQHSSPSIEATLIFCYSLGAGGLGLRLPHCWSLQRHHSVDEIGHFHVQGQHSSPSIEAALIYCSSLGAGGLGVRLYHSHSIDEIGHSHVNSLEKLFSSPSLEAAFFFSCHSLGAGGLGSRLHHSQSLQRHSTRHSTAGTVGHSRQHSSRLQSEC